MSVRDYKITGAGGFLLAQRCPGIEDYWRIGQEIDVYETPEECVEKCRFYVTNNEKREEMARAAYMRTVTEHTYFNRMQTILKHVYDKMVER